MELLTENTGPEKGNSYGMQTNERFALGIAFLLLEMNSKLPVNLCSITDSISVEMWYSVVLKNRRKGGCMIQQRRRVGTADEKRNCWV